MNKNCNIQAKPQRAISSFSEQCYQDEGNDYNSKPDHITQTSSCLNDDQNSQQFSTENPHQRQPKNALDLNISKNNLLSEKILKNQKNSDQLIRAGTLTRRSNSLFQRWMTFYCILTPDKLLCFQDSNRSNLMSCLNFKRVNCEIQLDLKFPQQFYIHCEGQNKTYYFQTQQWEQTSLWYRDIYKIINSFKKQSKIKIRQIIGQIYKEKDAVSEKQFLELTQSGDILLMQTEDTSCALQRFITSSQYDHVSIVVKFSDDDIKVFQANADEGVQIYRWQDFLNRFNHYQKICFRKLQHSHPQIQSQLLKFIKKTIGSTYELGPLKMMRKSSDEQLAGHTQSYFCSQLVAKAYKTLGLLNTDKVSSSYWPIDFTDKGSATLQKGSTWGPEILIVLEKHTINRQ